MYKKTLRLEDKAVIKRPKDIKEWPGWSEYMDEQNGDIVTLRNENFDGDTLYYKGYYFNKKWLHRIPESKDYHRLELVIIQDCKTFKNFAIYNDIATLRDGDVLNNVTFVTPLGIVRTIPKAEVLGRAICFSNLIDYAKHVPSESLDYYGEIDSIEEVEKPYYGIVGPKGMPGELEISSYEELSEDNYDENQLENSQIVILSFPGSSKQYAYVNVTGSPVCVGYLNDIKWITSNDELKSAKRAKVENIFSSFEEYLKAYRLNAFSQNIEDYSYICAIGSFETCALTMTSHVGEKGDIGDKGPEESISNATVRKNNFNWLKATASSSALDSHPESVLISPKPKKESKMNLLSSLNITCGKVNDPNLTASLNGVAIKGPDGQFRAYDKSKDKIMNVTGLTLGNDYLYVLPCALKDVKVGDVIVNADTFVTVIKVHNDGTFTVVDPKASEQKIAVPAQNIFGFNYVSKIVNLLDGMINPSDDNPFGINPLTLVLLDETKSNDNSNILFAAMLMGQEDMDMSSMLPFLLMGKNGNNDMLTMFAMMNMMKPQKKSERDPCAKSKVTTDDTDKCTFTYDELKDVIDKALTKRAKDKEVLDNASVPAPIEDDSKPEYLDDPGFVNYIPDGIVSYETNTAD